MRIVVIGATGHIGSYLVPRLVGRGHEVVALSRGVSSPYVDDPAFAAVERVHVDREAEDAAGTFGQRVADLQPDVVVDLICFTPDSARQLVAALQGSHVHLVHCGTIWVHGPAREVPVREDGGAEAAAGTSGRRVAALQPEGVVALICSPPAPARQLVAALQGSHVHLVHCGTIWVHGPAREVPVREDAPRRPFGAYGM